MIDPLITIEKNDSNVIAEYPDQSVVNHDQSPDNYLDYTQSRNQSQLVSGEARSVDQTTIEPIYEEYRNY